MMSNRRLTEAQIRAIEYMSLPKKGGLTYDEIAATVGVDVRTLYRWKRDDVFFNALTKKIVRDTVDRLPEVFASIPDHIIIGGNAAMFRTLLQAHGMLPGKVVVVEKEPEGIDVDKIRREVDEIRRRIKEA